MTNGLASKKTNDFVAIDCGKITHPKVSRLTCNNTIKNTVVDFLLAPPVFTPKILAKRTASASPARQHSTDPRRKRLQGL